MIVFRTAQPVTPESTQAGLERRIFGDFGIGNKGFPGAG